MIIKKLSDSHRNFHKVIHGITDIFLFKEIILEQIVNLYSTNIMDYCLYLLTLPYGSEV